MGFTCGLYKSRKFRYTQLATMEALSSYLNFIRNDIKAYEGYSKDFEGYEKFCKEVTHSDKYKCIPCFGTILDWYIANNEEVFTEIDTWCSGAVPFHTWLKEEFNVNSNNDCSCSVELKKEDVFKCLRWCEDYLDSHRFIPIVTDYAFTENEEDESIKLIPCDGVEWHDDEGNLSRSYSSTWELTDLYVCKEDFNDWEYYTIQSMKNTFIDIIETADFENETISYDGGW